MSAVAYGRGRLTDYDRARIQEFAENGLKAGRIAQLIKRHQSTVYWHMISQGLIQPKPSPVKAATYMRGTTTVYRYCADEDAFITALRIQGFHFEDIARNAAKRFSTKRTAHSVQVRLIMLAARDL